MCMRVVTWVITSIGQGDPAIIPVRRDEKSVLAKSAWASWAMNIVGTPNRLVQRSAATARSVAPASKAAAGYTMQAPWLVAARLPITMPKQWYSGTGMQTRSCSV